MTADVCAGLFLPLSSSGTIRTAGIIILICVTSSSLSGICIIGVLYGESALCSETWREQISNEACVMWVEAINILKALTFSCKWNAPQMASYQFISQDISCLFFVSCFTFLCRFNVCRSLPLHPSHFAPLSRLGGQNVWQEWKNRRETPGLDSTTYIKFSKHPPIPSSVHSPSCLKGSFTFPFYSIVSNESQYRVHSGVTSRNKYSFIYLHLHWCGYVLFISFSPCAGHFQPFHCFFPLPFWFFLSFWTSFSRRGVRDCLLRRAWTVVSDV